ncbi:MAG: hypothetical protein Q9162_003654 [Coniocarpon cinnabarinum]
MSTALRSSIRILPRTTLTHRARPSTVPQTAIPFTSQPPTQPSTSRTARTLSTTPIAREDHADHAAHDSHYDPPTGWLWGIPPGQKYEKEGWEGLWYYGFFGSLGLAAVAYAFKPDTSIETWALEEATRRLQREGLLPEQDEGQ